MTVFARAMFAHCVVLATVSASAHAQTRAEVIRGVVTSASDAPLRGVNVIATMAPDRTVRQALTDSAGRYEIRFELGTGDYLVYASAVGYRAFRKRVARTPNSDAIVVDIKLAAEATVLAAVKTTAPRPRVLPDFGLAGDPTAAEQMPNGLLGAVSPDQAGDLITLAQTVPGFSSNGGGSLVAFGMPGQVSTTFNGVSLAAGAIPADIRASVRVTTSAYDPSIGGFGAGRVNVEMAQGNRVSEAFGRFTLDAPALQYTSSVGARLNQPFTRFGINMLANGPVEGRDMWYNMGVQARRQTASALSLIDAEADVLQLAGLSPDALVRLRQATTSVGIPLTQAGIPGSRIDQSVSLVARIDRFADPARYGKLWDNALALSTIVLLNESAAPGSGPVTAPTFGRASRGGTGQAILTWLHMHERYSSEVTSSVSLSRSSDDPYVELPAARVRVESQLGDGGITTSSLALGGTASTSTSSSASWETIGVLGFYAGTAHKIKVYGRSQFEAQGSSALPNQFGTFVYNSLSDVAANAPASFFRTLSTPSGSATAWRGALAIGDLWQVTPSFQLQPGVRFEANHFFAKPVANAQLAEAFGVANDATPSTLHASPRLGFAWSYARPASTFTAAGGMGRIAMPPRGVLSGGIGEFRNDIGAAAILGAMSHTGLAGSEARLACFGVAVPVPDWSSYASGVGTIPRACVNGGASSLSDAAPGVQLFSRNYALPRSWRGNLRWGSAVKRMRYSADATYSRNVDQPGIVDLNFRRSPLFVLPNEHGRPIFVSPSSIVGGTGVVSSSEARLSPTFGQVLERVSDLHSTARQLTLTVMPELTYGVFRVDYTLGDVREVARGFDASTFESPTALVSARSRFDTRHSIMVTAGYRSAKGPGATMFWSIRSGTPYSPMVDSDINGDGLANDRAFVFHPDRAPDAVMASAMRSLLGSTSARARACLERQLGLPSEKNGCEGPWTSMMNAALTSSNFHVLDGRIATVDLTFTNPLGGIDQLLHGSDDLRGWGAPAVVDQTLYTVRGFDPSRNQYLYTVNSRFGSTRSSESTVRAPFRATMSVCVELGTPIRRKQFVRFNEMDAVKQNHAPAPTDSLRARLADRFLGNVYTALLRNRDSLLLTPAQADSLSAADARWRARAAPVWQEVASQIRVTNEDSDLRELSRRVSDAATKAWDIHLAEFPRMLALLAPAQQVLAREILKPLLQRRNSSPPYSAPF